MEIWGFLLVILVMVVVIIRRQLLQNKLKTQQNLDEATGQLQLQLEEVADEVIERMENRMDQLELLMAEADEKIGQIDAKIQLLQELSERVQAPRCELPPETEQKLEVLPVAPAAVAPHKKRAAIKLSPTNKMVIQMLEADYTLDEIAKQTGIGKGAILLIKGMGKLHKAEAQED